METSRLIIDIKHRRGGPCQTHAAAVAGTPMVLDDLAPSFIGGQPISGPDPHLSHACPSFVNYLSFSELRRGRKHYHHRRKCGSHSFVRVARARVRNMVAPPWLAPALQHSKEREDAEITVSPQT